MKDTAGFSEDLIIVRGAGDLASGVIHRLYRSGYHVLVLECAAPSAIRRMAAFCEAVYDGEAFVEGVLCTRVENIANCPEVWKRGEIPLLVDEKASCLYTVRPAALVDGIIAKRNLGTCKEMASLTIALGPGFCAGEDVDVVIETMRGHDLGRIIRDGEALPNTGIPGSIGGFTSERVIHSPAKGVLHQKAAIGDLVEKGQIIALVDETPVEASITGVLRGIIRDGYKVSEGLKIADIDPRKEEKKNCFTISDKSRCIAGSVLEVLLGSGIYPLRKAGFSRDPR